MFISFEIGTEENGFYWKICKGVNFFYPEDAVDEFVPIAVKSTAPITIKAKRGDVELEEITASYMLGCEYDKETDVAEEFEEACKVVRKHVVKTVFKFYKELETDV